MSRKAVGGEMSEKKLLFSLTRKDFIVEDIRGSGPGGQHRNKVCTAIRITHPASGAVGESQSEKSQLMNKRLAFQHLLASRKFQTWHKMETARRLTGKTVDQVVDEMLVPQKLRVEVVASDGKWQEEATQ